MLNRTPSRPNLTPTQAPQPTDQQPSKDAQKYEELLARFSPVSRKEIHSRYPMLDKLQAFYQLFVNDDLSVDNEKHIRHILKNESEANQEKDRVKRDLLLKYG